MPYQISFIGSHNMPVIQLYICDACSNQSRTKEGYRYFKKTLLCSQCAKTCAAFPANRKLVPYIEKNAKLTRHKPLFDTSGFMYPAANKTHVIKPNRLESGMYFTALRSNHNTERLPRTRISGGISKQGEDGLYRLTPAGRNRLELARFRKTKNA